MRGDKGIDYGTVMGVVSAINQAGFAKVALLTEVAAARPAARGRDGALRPAMPRAAAVQR